MLATSTYIALASMAYSLYEGQRLKRKARREAEAAAEQRRGVDIVADGESGALHFVYGRQSVGGYRVWAATGNDFTYTAPSSNKTFLTGGDTAYTYTVDEVTAVGETGTVTNTVTYTHGSDTTLDRTINGVKNEFLFVQQAHCLGTISNVVDVLVDGQPYNSAFGQTTGGDNGTLKQTNSATRIDVYYAGGTACKLMSLNKSNRADARFDNVVYSSQFFRIDRDNPRYQGLPSVQLIVEGRLIRTVTAGVLSTTRVYSTNPAWCLLDYLLDIRGRGLDVTEIDLPSFEACAAVFATQVMTGKPVGGRVWEKQNVFTRNIPLYECNISLDTAAPVKDNIAALMSTMGGSADLVWSNGKYKLVAQYPTSNANISLAGTLGDDQLCLDDKFVFAWPSSDTRLNYCTIRFKNEAMDFAEDTASWPPKVSGTVMRGIGTTLYTPIESWGYPGSNQLTAKFMGAYGVWNGASVTSSTMSWKFVCKSSSTHTVRLYADASATVTVKNAGGTTILTQALADSIGGTVVTATFTGAANQVFTVDVTAAGNTSTQQRAFAGTIVDANNVQVWSSRSPAYTSFNTLTLSNAVYNTYLAEDNNIPLEADEAAPGIVDYYHALAKAEERVRTSRSDSIVTLRYKIEDKFYEPGDFVKVDSPTLKISNLYLKITEASVIDELTGEITGRRFDYSQGAWNVADDQIIKAAEIYQSGLPPPAWVQLSVVGTNITANGGGRVTWQQPNDSRIRDYIILLHQSGGIDAQGRPVYVELGRAVEPPFDLPALKITAGRIGVQARSDFSVSGIAFSASTRFINGLPVVSGGVNGTNLVMNGDFYRRRTSPNDPGRPYDPEGYAVYDWNVGTVGVWGWGDEVSADGERAFSLTNVTAMSAKPDVSGAWVRLGFVTAANMQDGMTQGGVTGGWRPNTDYTISFQAYVARAGTGGGAESAITQLSSTGQSGTTPTGTGTVSMTLPVVAAGSLIIVVASLDDYATAGIAGPSGWTRIGAQQGATGNPDGRVTSAWYKIVAAGDPAAFVLSVTGGGGYTYSMACSCYSGCDTTTPVSVVGAWSAAGAGIATNQPITAPGITTTGNTGLVWLGGTDKPSGPANTLTAPSGYTMRRSQWDSTNASNAHIADKLPKAANGTVAATSGTLASGGAGYDFVLIALKPASTGGTVADAATEWEGVMQPELFWNAPPASVVNASDSQTISYLPKTFKFKIRTGATVEANGTLYVAMRRTTAITQMPGLAANARIVFRRLMVCQGTDYPAFERAPQDDLRIGSVSTTALQDEAATRLRVIGIADNSLNSANTFTSLPAVTLNEAGTYELTATVLLTLTSVSPSTFNYYLTGTLTTTGPGNVIGISGPLNTHGVMVSGAPSGTNITLTWQPTITCSGTGPWSITPLVYRTAGVSTPNASLTNISVRHTLVKK
jgi:hypothetical protein